jgi:hypothetical protein
MNMDEKQEWVDEHSKTFNLPFLSFPFSGCNCTHRKTLIRSFTESAAGGSQTLLTLEPCAQGESFN